MKGNEKDCICAKDRGRHQKYCDAYRLSEFLIKTASIITPMTTTTQIIMTPHHTKSCGSHPDSTHYHQPCSCSLLQKEMDAFRKLFPAQASPTGFGLRYFLNTPKNKVLWKKETAKHIEEMAEDFLRQSLPRFTRSVIEEAMPEERGTKNYSNSHEATMNSDKDYGFNTCRTQFQENTERILSDNEK